MIAERIQARQYVVEIMHFDSCETQMPTLKICKNRFAPDANGPAGRLEGSGADTYFSVTLIGAAQLRVLSRGR